jgi:hypothetical protein
MVHPAIGSAVVLASRLVLASGVLAMLATYARHR